MGATHRAGTRAHHDGHPARARLFGTLAHDLRTELSRSPLSAMPVEYQTPGIEDRAVAVQALLADHGHHRAVSVPDLIVAATAELARLTVLHLDKDFDLIAAVTGQLTERLE